MYKQMPPVHSLAQAWPNPNSTVRRAIVLDKPLGRGRRPTHPLTQLTQHSSISCPALLAGISSDQDYIADGIQFFVLPVLPAARISGRLCKWHAAAVEEPEKLCSVVPSLPDAALWGAKPRWNTRINTQTIVTNRHRPVIVKKETEDLDQD